VYIPLLHTHRSLAYVIFALALIHLMVVLSPGRNAPGFAKGLYYSHLVGIIWAGRVNLIIGVALTLAAKMGLWPWWIWVSIAAWGGVEVAAKRMITPELHLAMQGANPSASLWKGALIELISIGVIFGLISGAH